MGVVFKSEDSGVVPQPKKKDEDTYPKDENDYPELVLGKSDKHKVWLKGLHKDSIQRKHINEYQATYYRDHKDSLNKKRRERRLINKEKRDRLNFSQTTKAVAI